MPTKWKVLVALFAFWLVADFAVSDGKKYCRDGTTTSSSGRGTCAWHKGQSVQPARRAVGWIFCVGLGGWIYFSFLREHKGSPEIHNPSELPLDNEKSISLSTPPHLASSSGIDFAGESQNPKCPGCNGQMSLRMAKQGRYRGQQFWGCRDYPRCKGIIKYSGSSKQKTSERGL